MLRPYQQHMKDGIYTAHHAGRKNIIAVGPTGMGKTVLMSSISAEVNAPACAIAHRQELVGQISMAMARVGLHHSLIAPKQVIQFCITQHLDELGKSFYHSSAPFAVAGVDTLIRRADSLIQWRNSVKQWTIDEAHHVLQNNKWGKAVDLFPNAWGLGVTATPIRADRKSLHVEQGGVFDHMVIGPTMRDLIDQGYLCDYRIFAPPSSIDISKVKVSQSTGDFSAPSLREEAHKSTITGDIVKTYLNKTPGKRAIAFLVDVEQAVETAAAFQAQGIRAEAVSAKTPDSVRSALIKKFTNGQIDVLCNVDLFGEGFDVPAVEVVIMGRPTQSYGLYVQQFGRALRLLKGKEFGIIIDHVGNVVRHGLPDAPRQWSLYNDNYGKKKARDPNEIPVTTCLECFAAYEAVTKECPFCGHINEPADRSKPEFVDGDLVEFSPELLAQLRGERDKIDCDTPLIPHGAEPLVVAGITKRHGRNQVAQAELRDAISFWAGVQQQVHDRPDSEIYRRFYHRFGVDIMTAQTLNETKATALMADIRKELT